MEIHLPWFGVWVFFNLLWVILVGFLVKLQLLPPVFAFFSYTPVFLVTCCLLNIYLSVYFVQESVSFIGQFFLLQFFSFVFSSLLFFTSICFTFHFLLKLFLLNLYFVTSSVEFMFCFCVLFKNLKPCSY